MLHKTDIQYAVFLDRDGVINRTIIRGRKPYPPANLEELVIFPGTFEAVQSLHSFGFRVIVVTNQPDVAKGIQSKAMVESIHGIIRQQLQVDDIKVCYHIDEDDCLCRKPKPGMILNAAQEYNIDLSKSYVIGDRWRDIEAGKAAKCKTILVRPEISYKEPQAKGADAVVDSLVEAAAFIIKNSVDKRGIDA